jgi:hypothetical protein
MEKKLYNLLCETIFQAFLHVFFIQFFAFFTPGKQPYFEISEDDHPLNIVGDRRPRSLMNFRLGYAFVSPGVNSRGELVPASHGASRRRLGD